MHKQLARRRPWSRSGGRLRELGTHLQDVHMMSFATEWPSTLTLWGLQVWLFLQQRSITAITASQASCFSWLHPWLGQVWPMYRKGRSSGKTNELLTLVLKPESACLTILRYYYTTPYHTIPYHTIPYSALLYNRRLRGPHEAVPLSLQVRMKSHVNVYALKA